MESKVRRHLLHFRSARNPGDMGPCVRSVLLMLAIAFLYIELHDMLRRSTPAMSGGQTFAISAVCAAVGGSALYAIVRALRNRWISDQWIILCYRYVSGPHGNEIGAEPWPGYDRPMSRRAATLAIAECGSRWKDYQFGLHQLTRSELQRLFDWHQNAESTKAT
jgi:hypothetical protein